MLFICLSTNHEQMHKSTPLLYLLVKTAVNQRQSQKQCLKSLVFLSSKNTL